MLGLSPAAQISPAPIPRDPTATSRHGTQAGTEARARDAQGFLGSSLGLVSHKLSQQTAKPDKISKSSKNDQKVSKEFLAGYVSKNLGTMEVQRSLHRPRPEEQKVASPRGGATLVVVRDAPRAGEFGGSMERCSWTLLVPQPPELQ